MADEYVIPPQFCSSGIDVYVLEENEAGKYWDGNSYEDLTTTRDDFDIPATEVASTGQFKASVQGPAGYKRYHFYHRVDATPSHTNDIWLYSNDGYWDGSSLKGVTLGDGVVTDAKFTIPTLTTVATGIIGMIYQLWRRFFKPVAHDDDAGTIKTFADNGTTVITTQTVTEVGDLTTVGGAT